MALTEQVLGIVAQADLIGEMNMFQRPAAYEQLVKNDIVPVLLAVAKHIDEVNSPGELPKGAVSVAEVLNEFQEQLSAFQQQNLKLMQENAELKQDVATLKGRVTKIQKSGSGVAA